MNSKPESDLATSDSLIRLLGERLEALRLSRNLTQAQLAREAGISVSTLKRLERGESTALDAFVRVLVALRLQDHVTALLPDPGVRPIERALRQGRLRQRARPRAAETQPSTWVWGPESSE